MEIKQKKIELDDMVLDGRVFHCEEKSVLLTERQAEVLGWFMQHPNRVWATQLVSATLFSGYTASLLTSHLFHLRRRLAAAGIPYMIRTIGRSTQTCYVLPTRDAPKWLKNLLKGEEL